LQIYVFNLLSRVHHVIIVSFDMYFFRNSCIGFTTRNNLGAASKRTLATLPRLVYTNYFELMKIQRQYTIDKFQLHNNYKLAQRIYHPDKHSLNSTCSSEKRYAQQISSELNIGYFTLMNDILRAKYICDLLKLPTDTPLSDVMLEEMMKYNNILEDEQEYVVQQVRQTIEQKYTDSVNKLGVLFIQNECKAFAEETKYLQFLHNLKQRLFEKDDGQK